MRNSFAAATELAESLDYTDKNYTAEQVIRWLDGAEINGAGKFIFVEKAANTAVYSGSNSTFYIVHNGDKLRRCGNKFAKDMIADGKGIPDGTTDEFHARRGR